MTKPIGYYVSYKAGSESIVEQVVKEYGDYFQQLDRVDKCYLLYVLADSLKYGQTNIVSTDIYNASEWVKRLSRDEMEGLIEALIVQIRDA